MSDDYSTVDVIVRLAKSEWEFLECAARRLNTTPLELIVEAVEHRIEFYRWLAERDNWLEGTNENV